MFTPLKAQPPPRQPLSTSAPDNQPRQSVGVSGFDQRDPRERNTPLGPNVGERDGRMEEEQGALSDKSAAKEKESGKRTLERTYLSSLVTRNGAARNSRKKLRDWAIWLKMTQIPIKIQR